jgi:hypothetical protein
VLCHLEPTCPDMIVCGVCCNLTPQFHICIPTAASLSLQLRSANKFLNMDSFREWVFITPEEHIPLLVHFLEREVVRLPCLQPKKVGTACAAHPAVVKDIAFTLLVCA